MVANDLYRATREGDPMKIDIENMTDEQILKIRVGDLTFGQLAQAMKRLERLPKPTEEEAVTILERFLKTRIN